MTRVLLIGGGAREHAMGEAIVRGDGELFVIANHTNPGLAEIASQYQEHKETDVEGVVDIARTWEIDLVVIGPEAPEEAGLADAFEAVEIPCASPTKAAARIETDKRFMRELMATHNVPGQLAHHFFDNPKAAVKFLNEHGPVWAIKPVGLTGGKGVQVHGDHFDDVAGAIAYTQEVFASGAGGGTLQFEERAIGEEFTVMAFTDGDAVLPMVACQDHKRLREGDQGPNTGGMGSYSQSDGLLPFLTRGEYDDAVDILQALIDAMAAEGCPYRGAIYGQFMLTPTGPKVIEVNARLGDPEAMNVMHLLETNFVTLLWHMVEGTLGERHLNFRPHATVVKYLVPEGYGEGQPQKGADVHVDKDALAASGAAIYYASVARQDGALRTLGSRTMAILGEGETISEAERIAEDGVAAVSGNLFVRHDIGTAELIEKRIHNMQQIREK